MNGGINLSQNLFNGGNSSETTQFFKQSIQQLEQIKQNIEGANVGNIPEAMLPVIHTLGELKDTFIEQITGTALSALDTPFRQSEFLFLLAKDIQDSTSNRGA